MKSKVLYRAYRPEKFKDVVGQDHIVSILENQIKEKSISHAYLFSGSRGTGKTSVARIFAHEIGTTENDLYEIDAASNRGIDDIRAIRDGVLAMPYESEYKVYIIDEAHMLTKEAFNALLKTLEEPPDHIIFILATTEPDKLLETIISRCQLFSFKRPSRSVLREVILSIAKKEGFSIGSSSADTIALLAEGSFRDALGALEKVIAASSDKKLSVDELEEVLEVPKREVINKIIRGLAEGSASSSLSAFQKIRDKSAPKIILSLLLEKLRAILFLRVAPEMKKDLADGLSEEDLKELEEISKNSKNINSKTLKIFLDAYQYLGISSLPYLPIELAIEEAVSTAS